MVVFDADKRPHILVGIIVNAVHQVEDNMGVVGLRKCVLMKANACRRRHFGPDIVVLKQNLVIIGCGPFVSVRKCRAETALRISFFTGCELQLANGRHYQKIAKIGVPGTAKMRMRKPDDLAIVVLITGTVFIRVFVIFAADVVRLLISVG